MQSVGATLKALDHWFWNAAVGPWMFCFCADYRDLSLPQDHEHVTYSREKMLGRKLEDVQAGREDRLPKISAALEPLRAALGQHRVAGRRCPQLCRLPHSGRHSVHRFGVQDAGAGER